MPAPKNPGRSASGYIRSSGTCNYRGRPLPVPPFTLSMTFALRQQPWPCDELVGMGDVWLCTRMVQLINTLPIAVGIVALRNLIEASRTTHDPDLGIRLCILTFQLHVLEVRVFSICKNPVLDLFFMLAMEYSSTHRSSSQRTLRKHRMTRRSASLGTSSPVMLCAALSRHILRTLNIPTIDR